MKSCSLISPSDLVTWLFRKQKTFFRASESLSRLSVIGDKEWVNYTVKADVWIGATSPHNSTSAYQAIYESKSVWLSGYGERFQD